MKVEQQVDVGELSAYFHQRTADACGWTRQLSNRLADIMDFGAGEIMAKEMCWRWDMYGKYFPLMESPIEQQLFLALTFTEWPLFGTNNVTRLLVDHPSIPLKFDLSCYDGYVVALPQHQIEEYRVDFLIRAKFHDRPLADLIVIECDGHDFHERTKEQAARDKSRDRRLTSLGLRVLRFTGSEIYRDPFVCVRDVNDVLGTIEYDGRPENR